MKKSRKLAWVVLGVVVLGALGMVVFLASLYGPWHYANDQYVEVVLTMGEDGQLYAKKQREQRIPWLPGADVDIQIRTVSEWRRLGVLP